MSWNRKKPKTWSGGSRRRCAARTSTRRRTRSCSAASTTSSASTQEALQRRRASSSASSATRSWSTACGCRAGRRRCRLRARPARPRHREDHDHARHHPRGDPDASSPCSAIARRRVPLPDRLAARGVRHITLGRVVVEEVTDDQAGIAAAQARLCRRRRDGGNAVGVGEGGRPARPGRRAQDHRRPGAAGDPGSHVADGADRAEEVRQLHVHAHGERRGAGDGAGARAEPRRRAAPRVRVRRADARHRQGQHAARSAEQARTS